MTGKWKSKMDDGCRVPPCEQKARQVGRHLCSHMDRLSQEGNTKEQTWGSLW